MRKQGPMIICTLAGLILIFSRYFQVGRDLGMLTTWDRWFMLSSGMAIGVGAINLTILHAKNVMRRTQYWQSSVILLVCMYGYMALAIHQTTGAGIPLWIFQSFMVTANSTLFSMVVFFIFSAAFRAFRIRSREAALLGLVAIITMFGVAPIGDALIPGWSGLKDWLLDVPNMAGFRGIQIGAYLGAFATAIRILLGLERAHMGGGGR